MSVTTASQGGSTRVKYNVVLRQVQDAGSLQM